ncbi:hypothetical protein G6553_06200 [Nocardioides sp. IC4_145]|uniref:hypothetical protein n=1 Tax=Nocardioides sp. IC4_145 TaxID=2714037 RepID=UPI001409211B|nr:hypothetical protein [Nocardioides sp. IC4_145]NHC22766.1 hypothetical protein [Nocardioides sp. IC4_145]
MFTHVCTACAKRQLIFPSQVTAVAESEQGPVATFTCWCGAEQSALYTLAPATSDKVVLAA